jgi:hypothetical protein
MPLTPGVAGESRSHHFAVIFMDQHLHDLTIEILCLPDTVQMLHVYVSMLLDRSLLLYLLLLWDGWFPLRCLGCVVNVERSSCLVPLHFPSVWQRSGQRRRKSLKWRSLRKLLHLYLCLLRTVWGWCIHRLLDKKHLWIQVVLFDRCLSIYISETCLNLLFSGTCLNLFCFFLFHLFQFLIHLITEG